MQGQDKATSDLPARRALGYAKFALALALLGGLLLVVIVESLLAMETVESQFPTGRALRDAGMVEKGWVPGWIPNDAFDVREIHNVDNNLSGLGFRLRTGAKLRLPQECTRGTAHGFAEPRFDRDWLDVASGHFDLYTCPAERQSPGDTDKFRAVAAERRGSRVISWTFRAPD